MQYNYFIIFDTRNGAFLPLETNKGIRAYETQKEATDTLELMYNKYHNRESVTWSTSVMIHWMQLKPFVIALDEDMKPEAVVATLVNNLEELATLHSYSLSSVAIPRMDVIKVDLNVCLQHKVADIKLIS